MNQSMDVYDLLQKFKRKTELSMRLAVNVLGQKWLWNINSVNWLAVSQRPGKSISISRRPVQRVLSEKKSEYAPCTAGP